MNQYLAHLPPVVISEVTSHVFALGPALRTLVTAAETVLTGEELEGLLVGAWLAGYATGASEGVEALADGKQFPLLEWAKAQGAE